jgi:hypothetical protein
MARSKPKKVFYNRRYKLPAWGQLYAVWSSVTVAALVVLFFTSVEKVPSEPAASLPVALNGFAEGLFYELRDAESGTQADVILAYAKRLEKKHGYKVREEKTSGCKSIRMLHGNAPHYGLATLTEGEKSQTAFALLAFLDRIVPANPAAAVDARILFASKNCDADDMRSVFTGESYELPVILETAETNLSYDRVLEFKNLKIRRYFEQAFLTRERTLWADVMAMIASEPTSQLSVSVKAVWPAGPEIAIAQNPLLKHPAAGKILTEGLAKPVALYLAADVQLFKGGFIALMVLFWFLAAIPLANALGTFNERLDLGSALTSTVLYAIAFFAYFLVVKVVLNFAKSDFAVILFSVFLLPVFFFPVRILQKNLLRAELNRAGLHILVQIFLTVMLFLNPLIALAGFAFLMTTSGFSRADLGRKIIRLIFVGLLLTAFYFMTRQPLGNFTNFFTALIPAFTAAGVFKIILLALIGGNLVALFFVPRERV